VILITYLYSTQLQYYEIRTSVSKAAVTWLEFCTVRVWFAHEWPWTFHSCKLHSYK